MLTINGLQIDKNKINKNNLEKICSELYVIPKKNNIYGNDVEGYKIYKENDEFIYIPKFYGTSKSSKFFNINNIDIKNEEYKKIDIQFKGTLRENQTQIVDVCFEKIKKYNGGIIELPCASGKTVIMLYLICLLGVKTLVVTHKSFLQEQWAKRCREFTTASIGFIRQNKTDTDKDIVIGMLHSISMKNYDEKIFSDFGLVIYDEVHHLAARIFSNSMFKTCFKYTFGLTATLQRNDGLTKVIHWHIGNLLYQIKSKDNDNVRVKCFLYESANKLFCEKKCFFKGKYVTSIPLSLTALTQIEERNNFLIQIINIIKNNSSRKILCLSARIIHLELIKQKIDSIIENEVRNNTLEINEIITSLYIGKNTELERRDAEEHADIIFGSYDMAQEGLDIKRINTIIMLTPPIGQKCFIQSIGRCMRETNNFPLIVDISDQLSMYNQSNIKRNKYYKSHNYIYNEYFANNENIITKKQYLKEKYNLSDEKIAAEFGDKLDDYSADLNSIFDDI